MPWFLYRVKDPENLTDDIKMKLETKHGKDKTSFKGEMIENELYKSGDDVLVCDSNGDNTWAMGTSSATRCLKEKSRTQLKVEQYEYSYIKMQRRAAQCCVWWWHRWRFRCQSYRCTPDTNHDSENDCQYAVVNKSRKMWINFE